jgi:hypothetical protein
MCLMRVIRISYQLSAVSYQQELRNVVGHRQELTVPFRNRSPSHRPLSPKEERGELVRIDRGPGEGLT